MQVFRGYHAPIQQVCFVAHKHKMDLRINDSGLPRVFRHDRQRVAAGDIAEDHRARRPLYIRRVCECIKAGAPRQVPDQHTHRTIRAFNDLARYFHADGGEVFVVETVLHEAAYETGLANSEVTEQANLFLDNRIHTLNSRILMAFWLA